MGLAEYSVACGRADRARTNFSKIKPGVDSQIVPIVPGKLQRVFADGLGRDCFHGRLEHGQGAGGKLWRLASLSTRLRTLILAERAGASVAQERKGVGGLVPILPLNFHSGSGGEMDHDRLRIVAQPGREIRQRHEFQYRTRRCVSGMLTNFIGRAFGWPILPRDG